MSHHRHPRLTHQALAASEHDFIRDVWAHNLDEELDVIREIVEEFPFVAMVADSLGFARFFALHLILSLFCVPARTPNFLVLLLSLLDLSKAQQTITTKPYVVMSTC